MFSVFVSTIMRHLKYVSHFSQNNSFVLSTNVAQMFLILVMYTLCVNSVQSWGNVSETVVTRSPFFGFPRNLTSFSDLPEENLLFLRNHSPHLSLCSGLEPLPRERVPPLLSSPAHPSSPNRALSALGPDGSVALRGWTSSGRVARGRGRGRARRGKEGREADV